MLAAKLKTQVRREQIAWAALRLVAGGGLKRLSMAAIARQVGFGPTAVYRHFKSKDEVLDAALALVGTKLQENVKAVHAEAEDPLERLRRLLARHIALIRDNDAIPRVVFSEDFYAGHPERKLRMYRGIQMYLKQVAQIIRQGQASGQVETDFDAEDAAVMFLGLVQPSAILWHMSDGEFDVTRTAERTWRLFLKAIQKTQATKG